MIIVLILVVICMTSVSIMLGFKNLKLKEDILNKEHLIKLREMKIDKLENKIQSSEFARKAMVKYYLNANDSDKVKDELSYDFDEKEDGTCTVSLGLCKKKGCLMDQHEYPTKDAAIYAAKIVKDLGYKTRETMCTRCRKESHLGRNMTAEEKFELKNSES